VHALAALCRGCGGRSAMATAARRRQRRSRHACVCTRARA
jgi:hypothetical protein